MTATNYHYNNKNAQNEYAKNIEAKSDRWGGFVEKIISCQLGILVERGSIIDQLIKGKTELGNMLKHPLSNSQYSERVNQVDDEVDNGWFYRLIFEI